VGLFALLTIIRSAQIGIPLRDPGGAFFWGRLALSLGLFALLVLGEGAVHKFRNRWSMAQAANDVRVRWPRERVVLALSGLLAYYVVYACYHNLKSWDVFNPPRDGSLVRIDDWLFLGHSPAVLLQDLLGQHLAAYVLVVIYESFGYLVTVTVVATLVFAREIRDAYVFVASSLWIWVLGVGSYYLVPSLGPFWAARDDFAALPHTVVSTNQELYLTQRTYVLQHPQASDAFAQISAFASLHVGVTCMFLLLARYFAMRRLTIALAIYLVATCVATVYLGWHYVVDDIAGIVLAIIAVSLGRKMIYPSGRPSPAAGSRGGPLTATWPNP
jgi:membrane-associated phospholipid phosphatase